MTNFISLPLRTDVTHDGPIISARGMGLSLKYDYHQYDGTFSWVEIEFDEVLAYRFDHWVCADDDQYVNSREMGEFHGSAWLLRALDQWDVAVGGDKAQIDKGGRSRFKHYAIYFDDVGTLEVICSRYQINPSS